MDGVKQQIQARQIESLDNKHIYNVKKIKRDMRAELDRLRENTQAAILKVKTGYDRQVVEEKLDLEKKLTDIRKKNSIMLKEENERFSKLLEETKLNHQEQLTELKESQEKEIEQQELTHEKYMHNSSTKLEAQKNSMS